MIGSSNPRRDSRVGAFGTLVMIELLALPACHRQDVPVSAEPAAKPWFIESAADRGLVFRHVSGHKPGRYLFPETVCGGAALFDMDNDGDLDAYLVQGGSLIDPPDPPPPNRLFRNRGDGTFEDVTDGSGAECTNDPRGYGMGVAAGDYDNDGDTDLYVTRLGTNVLLRNDGLIDGRPRFTDVTSLAGVGGAAGGWGAGAAFLDYDADGDLDLFVVNYIHWSPETEIACVSPSGSPDYCHPNRYNAPTSNALYRNNGDGTFTDVSESAGLHEAFANGLGIVCGDFNSDGWIDVAVADDATPNLLWINQRDGRFINEAPIRGFAVDESGRRKAGMGIDAADLDDDGDLDLLIVNLQGETDSFYRNEGGRFVDDTAAVGLGSNSRAFTRFGMVLADFDNDGRLDLYHANGRVRHFDTLYGDDPFAEPNELFRGLADGRFQVVQPRGGTNPPLIATSRASAFGDIDNDGGIDILIVNRDGPAHLLRNVAADDRGSGRGHWIMFKVLEEHGRDALGAAVQMTAGGRRRTAVVRSAASYCSANDPRVHVGLGADAKVGDVRVQWPDRTVEHFGSFDADQIVTLRKGSGTRD